MKAGLALNFQNANQGDSFHGGFCREILEGDKILIFLSCWGLTKGESCI